MANFRTPAFAYPGGKVRLANRIVGMLDIGAKRYVDVFAGRGNVFFAAASLHYDEYWLNDPATASFFEALLSKVLPLSAIPETPSRELFEKYKEKFSRGQLEAILLEPYLTFSGGGYLNVGTRCGQGTNGGPSREAYYERLLGAHEILRGFQPRITSLDWKDVVRELSYEDMVFVDPPYIHALESNLYKKKMTDHEELAKTLKNAKFKWLLTEYKHELYTDYLGEPFREIEMPLIMESSKNIVGVGRGSRTECIWKNY